MRLPAAMRPLVSTPWIWSKGCWAGCGDGMTSGALGLRIGNLLSADLNEVRVAVEAEGFAAGWGDAQGSPCGLFEERDGGVAYGFKAGEAIGDLGLELRDCGFVSLGWGERD